MSIEPSPNTVESPETIPSPVAEATDLSLRDELSALLIPEDAPPESVSLPDESVVEPEPVAETPAVEALAAPQHWPEAERTRFATLPRESQEWLLERNKGMEADYTKRSQEIAALEKSYGDLVATFKPYEQELKLKGMTPASVVNQLLAAQSVLNQNPAEGLKWLARSYNVDLKTLVPSEQEYVDPTVKALQDQVQALNAQIQGFTHNVQQTKVTEAAQQIESFQTAKNEDGTQKYPGFDQVRSLMAPLVAQGKSLEQAYEEVKYVLPEVRSRIADEAAKAARSEILKKAEEDKKAKAASARTASSTIRSRSVPAESSGKDKTLREDLAEALNAQLSQRI